MSDGTVGKTRRVLAGAVLACAATGLGACGLFSAKEDPYVDQPVDQLYNRALDALGQQDYKAAAKGFEEVDRQHPYSVWATKAELMVAFTYYESNKYDDAIIALDRFIQLHPGHRDARDARLKAELAIDHLAGKEMDIGRYYQRQGIYIAAINRYRTVVERYQSTTHVPEALNRLVESYTALGVKSEAQSAASVLGYNFPGSDWYADSYYLLTGEDLRPPSEKPSWWKLGIF